MDNGLKDNRGASRYAAVKHSVYLGWWAEDEFRTCAARLIDLGQGGALVHVALMPPPSGGLWLCRGGTSPDAWVEAEVVAREPFLADFVKLHVRFPSGCPFELFEGAVLGLETVS